MTGVQTCALPISGVQARRRVEVSFLEAAHAHVAARAEQAVVGADVEVDLVGGRPRGLAIHGSPYQGWVPVISVDEGLRELTSARKGAI